MTHQLDEMAADVKHNYIGCFKRNIRNERQQGNLLLDSAVEIRAYVLRAFSVQITTDVAVGIAESLNV